MAAILSSESIDSGGTMDSKMTGHGGISLAISLTDHTVAMLSA